MGRSGQGDVRKATIQITSESKLSDRPSGWGIPQRLRCFGMTRKDATGCDLALRDRTVACDGWRGLGRCLRHDFVALRDANDFLDGGFPL
jgi:hypothetical protein